MLRLGSAELGKRGEKSQIGILPQQKCAALWRRSFGKLAFWQAGGSQGQAAAAAPWRHSPDQFTTRQAPSGIRQAVP